MLINPKINQLVQLKYSKKKWPKALLQGKIGKIVIVGRGKPRNHAIEIDGIVYVVPCGNMFSVTEEKIIDIQSEAVSKKPIQLKLFSK